MKQITYSDQSKEWLASGTALLWLGLVLAWAAAPNTVQAGDVLVPAHSLWKFLDTGVNQGTAWRASDFNDATWRTGAAELGYGDGGEATLLGFGASDTNKYITTYFRREFQVDDLEMLESISAGLLRDDGAVVYLNGVEWFRSNMPAGAIDYATKASSSVGAESERAFYRFDAPTGRLLPGRNVLAVEVHQNSPSSSDISFDFWLEATRRSLSVTVEGPANGASDMASPVDLNVRVSDPEGAPVSVVFYGREVPPAGRDFTLLALPDTQYYAGSKNGGTPAMFLTQVEWILANRAAMNLAFLTQLGDCVENGDNGGNDVEWRHATNALYRLEDPVRSLLAEGIPYGVAVGNHDQSAAGDADGTTSFFNLYFGESHFLGRDYYGGHYGTNNDNHFELFSASGMDFIIVHLEYDAAPDQPVLDWADALLKAHPSRRAIIVSHYLMEVGDQGAFGAQGQAVYDALSDNPNLFLMLCGHVPGEGRRTDLKDGRVVHTVLSDYQGRANGGDGWLRTLEFSPSNNVIRVKTFSPTQNRYETDADSEFTLPYDMRNKAVPYVELGRVSGVPSGGQASLATSRFNPGAIVEWYAVASAGSSQVASAVQSFTTAADGGGALIAPTSLTAVPGASQAIDLRWSDNSANEVGFVVERSADGVRFERLGLVEANTRFFCDAAAKAPGEYAYRVCAYGTAGVSTPSNEARAMVVVDPVQDAHQPMRMVSPLGGGRIGLEWASQAGLTYRVTFKNDLSDASWTDLTGDIPGTGGVAAWSELISPQIPRRFYAVRIVR